MLPRAVGVRDGAVRIPARGPFPGRPLALLRLLPEGSALNQEGWGQVGSAAPSSLYGDAALAVPELWGFLEYPPNPHSAPHNLHCYLEFFLCSLPQMLSLDFSWSCLFSSIHIPVA